MTAIGHHMDEPHMRHVEPERAGTQESLLCDSLHIKFKSRHNPVVFEVRMVVTLGRHEGLLGAGHAPLFNLNAGYPGRFIWSEFI